jgi:hypothetical protein
MGEVAVGGVLLQPASRKLKEFSRWQVEQDE